MDCPHTYFDAAIKAIEILKEWSVWLIGGGIAFMGVYSTILANHPDRFSRLIVSLTLIFLGASVIASACVVWGLPDLVVYLKKSFACYCWLPVSDLPIFHSWLKLGWLMALQHTLFGLGVACFVLGILFQHRINDA